MGSQWVKEHSGKWGQEVQRSEAGAGPAPMEKLQVSTWLPPCGVRRPSPYPQRQVAWPGSQDVVPSSDPQPTSILGLYCQGGAGCSPHSFILFLNSGTLSKRQYTTPSAFPPPWKEEQGRVREEQSPALMPLSQEGAGLCRSDKCMLVLRDSSLNPPVTVSVSPGPDKARGRRLVTGEASRESDIGTDLSRCRSFARWMEMPQ